MKHLDAPYRTHGGVMVDLLNPDPGLITLEDIAHHLARVCRFGGAVDGFYSIASHSVYVARALAEDLDVWHPRARRQAALLHDAAEAYIGDMVTGLKRRMPEYKAIEDLWEAAIETRFGVRFRHDPVIKDADLRARLSECRDLFVGYPRELLLGGEGDRQPFPQPCVCETPDEAEFAFLRCAYELGVE